MISLLSPLGGPPPEHQDDCWSRWQHWLRAGTRLATEQVTALDPDRGSQPSLLPGWSRRDVLAHLALNAGALLNLLSWARTGARTPMYPNPAARADAIRRQAELPWVRLTTEFHTSASRLAFAVARMPYQNWDARVRTATGRDVSAREVLWLRVREVWIHSVDLDHGLTFAAFPAELIDALLDDVSATLSGREPAVGFTVAPTDRARQWQVGVAPQTTMSGTAAESLGVLIGRATPDVLTWSPAPPSDWLLPRWL